MRLKLLLGEFSKCNNFCHNIKSDDGNTTSGGKEQVLGNWDAVVEVGMDLAIVGLAVVLALASVTRLLVEMWGAMG